MTRLAAQERCERCGGLLVPPLAVGSTCARGVDYVCVTCGQPFRWVGTPPTLQAFSIADEPRPRENDADE